MYHYLQNVQNFINTFSYYYEINYIYNSIYFNSFVNATKEINQKNMSNDENRPNKNILSNTFFPLAQDARPCGRNISDVTPEGSAASASVAQCS